MVAVKVNGS